MRHLLTGLLCTGTLLLGACGGGEAEALGEPNLETSEQAASPCRPSQYTRVTYFSDSTKTVEVGHLICSCTGTTTTYGQTTTFTSVSYALCK
ncbi:hypothetical protein [Corallococcus sp. M7]